MKIVIIALLLLLTVPAIAGTILLMGIGNGAPGGGGACSNSLDFTAACNSQYITVVGGF